MDKQILIELFTSPTCPYCPKAKNIAEKIVKEIPNALLIERDVTINENAEISRKYGIQGVPTMIINGTYRIVGVPNSEREVINYLKQI